MSQKYALISVFNKHGIVEGAKYLVANGYKILSTGGTAKLLKDNGVDVITVEEYTGNCETGLVKTLHPKIFSNILEPDGDIEIVVVNLYDLKDDMNDPSFYSNIDIGGHSLLRAAIKGRRRVFTEFPDLHGFNEANDTYKVVKYIADYDRKLEAAFSKLYMD